jgi:hypothetical protein
MGLVETIEGGINRAIYKGIKHAGTAIAGVAAALLLKYLKFPLSDEHQVAIAVAVTGGLGTLLKVVKDKFPKQLGWL